VTRQGTFCFSSIVPTPHRSRRTSPPGRAPRCPIAGKAECPPIRTIRTSHPWSNGKVEALNRVLKYQCLAAIAGNISDWHSACDLVERWMHYYNTQRSHSGHANKGLPPIPFYELYRKTEGDHLATLIKLGVAKLDNEWSVRLMGGDRKVTGEGEDFTQEMTSDGPDEQPHATSFPSPSSWNGRRRPPSGPSTLSFARPTQTVTL